MIFPGKVLFNLVLLLLKMLSDFCLLDFLKGRVGGWSLVGVRGCGKWAPWVSNGFGNLPSMSFGHS